VKTFVQLLPTFKSI